MCAILPCICLRHDTRLLSLPWKLRVSNNSTLQVGCNVVFVLGLSSSEETYKFKHCLQWTTLSWKDVKVEVFKVWAMHTKFIPYRRINKRVELLERKSCVALQRNVPKQLAQVEHCGATSLLKFIPSGLASSNHLWYGVGVVFAWSHHSTLQHKSFHENPPRTTNKYCNWMRFDTTFELIKYLIQ